MSEQRLLEMRHRLDEAEAARLSPLACPSRAALRRLPDPLAEDGHRQAFALDADRILHSLAYTRYIDKTQVFSLVDNDHITHRVLHVQLVSKIGRTVGRFLGLNEDLIEAIALGHDIGHPPFGHDGERFLGEKCIEHGLGPFQHNVQGVHFLERVEKRGRGLNLSLQALDGVLCHDGEAPAQGLAPQRDKGFASLDAELEAKAQDPKRKLAPMTLEGCVVRLADSLAYMGRDFEDAIRLGLIKRGDLPESVREVLGDTNGTIVYRLVQDLISTSAGQDLVGYTPRAAQALAEMKRFNYQNIYLHPAIKTQHAKIRDIFHRLFDRYLDDLRRDRQGSLIIKGFLGGMDPVYRDTHSEPVIVRDFMAGMTDEFLLRRFEDMVWPRRLLSALPPSPARFR